MPSSIYPPRSLRERVEREARYLNNRDDCNDWNFSAVVVDILLDHFGMEKPGEDQS